MPFNVIWLGDITNDTSNILKPKENGCNFASNIFIRFIEWKVLHFYSYFTEICFWRTSWQYVNIGSGNVLAPHRRQTIVRSNNDRGLRGHVAPLCRIELNDNLCTHRQKETHDLTHRPSTILPTVPQALRNVKRNDVQQRILILISVTSLPRTWTFSPRALPHLLACRGLCPRLRWQEIPKMTSSLQFAKSDFLGFVANKVFRMKGRLP